MIKLVKVYLLNNSKVRELLPKNLIFTAKKSLPVDHFYRWWKLQMIVVVLDAL